MSNRSTGQQCSDSPSCLSPHPSGLMWQAVPGDGIVQTLPLGWQILLVVDTGMAVSFNNRRRTQKLLQRAPWITHLMRIVLQYIQPHFTAGVVGVVLNGRGEVLVVEHVFHPEHPWGLPGGWLERGESPADGLIRELREETGIQVSVGYPLLVEAGYYFRTHLDIAFLCHAESDVTGLSSELLDYRWVDLNAVPHMLPFHQAAIQEAVARRRPEVVV